MRVSTGDGFTVLTRIFIGAHSSAAERIRPITACLLVTYGEMPGDPPTPATDDVITMLPPPRLASAGMADFNPSQTPRTFTAMTLSNISTSYSVIGLTIPSMPALARNVSTPP